jgi:hypothetical protein
MPSVDCAATTTNAETVHNSDLDRYIVDCHRLIYIEHNERDRVTLSGPSIVVALYSETGMHEPRRHGACVSVGMAEEYSPSH